LWEIDGDTRGHTANPGYGKCYWRTESVKRTHDDACAGTKPRIRGDRIGSGSYGELLSIHPVYVN